jgi:hypothetical protein
MRADLWKSVALNRADAEMSRDYWNFQAKLKPGVTIQQAQADIDILAHRLAKVYPTNYPDKFSIQIVTWLDSLVGAFENLCTLLGRRSGCCCSSRARM